MRLRASVAPLTSGQELEAAGVAGPDDGEVAAIEGCQRGELEPLDDRDQGGDDEVQPQAGILLDRLCAPLPVRLG